MKVLVLGHNGMLGNAVFKYLSTNQINLVTTNLRWPDENFKKFTCINVIYISSCNNI